MNGHGLRLHRRSSGRAAAPDGAQASLVEVIDRAHAAVWQGLGLPPHATPGHLTPVMDGYDAEDAYDAEVATLSAHLATMEAVLHPVVRRRLTTGRALAAAQRRRSRHLEQLMRLIEGRWYGDSHAAGLDVERLQGSLTREITTYIHAERDLAGRLDDALTPPQRRALLGHYSGAITRAPTRPHPYAPHPRGLAGATFRLCAVWDRAMDVMDNRTVPGPVARRRTKALSRWDSYALGSPQFEEVRTWTDRTGPRSAAAEDDDDREAQVEAVARDADGEGDAARQREAGS